MKIAIAGKGGTGKTTLASLIVRSLIDQAKGSVLAVDADPNANMASALGVSENASIVNIIEEIAKNPDVIPQGTSKDRFIELKVQEAVVESKGFDALTMGRPEGPGCYCYANNILRGLLDDLQNSYGNVVIDNEAGLEHLSRRLTRKADLLAIVAEPTVVSIRTAGRIYELVKELDITFGKAILIVNKVGAASGGEQHVIPESARVVIPECFNRESRDVIEVPYDEELVNMASSGGTVFDISKNNKVYSNLANLTRLV